jgi:hypothetical protein
MKLSKPAHKAFLVELFSVDTPSGKRERRFPLAELMTASGCMKKLTEDTDPVIENGVTVAVRFRNSEVSFTIDEAKLLKTLFLGVTDAVPSQAETIAELTAILE